MREGGKKVTEIELVAGVPNERFFLEALAQPPMAFAYGVTHALAAAFPDRALIETNAMCAFDVEGYAAGGHCTLKKLSAPRPQVLTWWMGHAEMSPLPRPDVAQESANGVDLPSEGQEAAVPEPETHDRIGIAWLQVEWQGAGLDVVMVIPHDGQMPPHYWLLAETEAVARGFLAAVCRWSMELRGEVLVFENGNWHKDEALFEAIQGATFDNLILRGQLKQEIRDDAHRFFAAQATYEEYGIPWKRGILLVGPPGNGKTLTVKALVNSLPVPCLYVKNFRVPHGVDEMSIRLVFDRARRMAPCLLVLEDLDAQLTPQNRSYFLNELDGFALNRGILTLATTNHPERLDPAILDRPSRFDRKYPFDLPEQPERQAYVALWNSTLKSALRLTDEGIAAIGAQTEGFSFAYLKELGLSSMMAWIAAPERPPMDVVMADQVAKLREQMMSAPPEPEFDPSQMAPMHELHAGFGPPTPGFPGHIRLGRQRPWR